MKLIEQETGHWAAIFIFHCNAKYKRRIRIFVMASKILWYFMIFGWNAQGIKALAHLSRVIILHQNATTGEAATFATIAKFVQHFKRKKNCSRLLTQINISSFIHLLLTLENTKLENNKHYPHSILCIMTRDGRPAPRGGGVSPPRPALWGRGDSLPRPAPRKWSIPRGSCGAK